MSKELPPSRTAEQFVVRFPEGMRNQIAEAAKVNNRSMNAEIVARLEQSFSHPPSSSANTELTRVVEELESLQLLGTLNYRLQRTMSHVDNIDQHLRAGWNELQDALKSGTPVEQKRVKEALEVLRAQRKELTNTIEEIEAKISEIHLTRKISNLRELRDVKPVYVSVRGGPLTDTGVVVPTTPPSAKLAK